MRWVGVVFGVTCSPFHLAAVLQTHLDKMAAEYPATAARMRRDLFVDDLITGADTREEGEKLAREAVHIAAEAAMPLRRWRTNDADLQSALSTMAKEEHPDPTKTFEDGLNKVLGIVWNRPADIFTFELSALQDYCETMRHRTSLRVVLSISARVYDVFGFVSTVSITAKILMQNIWRRNLEWDEELPTEMKRDFWTWVDALKQLADVSVPRFYLSKLNSAPYAVELHVFCDASEKAYGAVAYLRMEDQEGNVDTVIVASKAKVAPVQSPTLPRLELLGGYLAIKLARLIESSLEGTLSFNTHYWTDSMVSLHWITGDAGRWKQYVANRVRYIQQRSQTSQWHFVAGKENPADLCSRGVDAADLVLPDSIWWTGPPWLRAPKEDWPSGEPDTTEFDGLVEREKKAESTVSLIAAQPAAIFDVHRYSTLTKLLRITAYILRGFRNAGAAHLDATESITVGAATAIEIQRAKAYWLRHLQSSAFAKERERLQQNREVPLRSSIARLQPWLDREDGLIKLRGRIGLSNLLDETPDVPILPARLPCAKGQLPHFLLLLIRHTHIKLSHAGVRDTLADLRESVWIIRGRQVVKSVIVKCVKCNRVQRRRYEQPVAPLPAARCSKFLPFEVTGVDYAGPLYIRDQGGKAWFIVFTCGTTRAIHLELVTSMTTKSFIMAYVRFIGRRGACRIVYSDNAKTFKSADRTLTKIYRDAQEQLANDGVEWRFIAEGAPWWGGFWERMVRSVESALKKTLGRALLTEVELNTALVKVEAVLNSRPVSYQPDNPRDPRPITPSDILLGRRGTTLPTAHPMHVAREYSHTDAANRLRYLDKLTADYFERFKKDYLRERALHYERRRQIQEVQIGEIVLIEADNVKRQEWTVGVVIELYPSVDGVVRSVRLRTGNGELRRPVQRLCSLELRASDEPPLPRRPLIQSDPDSDDGESSENDDAGPNNPVPANERVRPTVAPTPNENLAGEQLAIREPPDDESDPDLQDQEVLQGGSVENSPATAENSPAVQHTRLGRPVRRPARYAT